MSPSIGRGFTPRPIALYALIYKRFVRMGGAKMGAVKGLCQHQKMPKMGEREGVLSQKWGLSPLVGTFGVWHCIVSEMWHIFGN